MSASCKRFTTPTLDIGKIETGCMFCDNSKNLQQWTGGKFVINCCHRPGSPEKSLKNSEMCMQEFIRECSRNYTWEG